jgi:hypothetical protein
MFASTSISQIKHLAEDVSRQLLFFEGLKFNLFSRVRACACARVCLFLPVFSSVCISVSLFVSALSHAFMHSFKIIV